MDIKEAEKYMVSGRRAHLIGIGGVSMSTLAEALTERGLTVTGSDIKEGAAVKRLEEEGIPVAIGHRAENIGNAEFIVRTAAVHDDNPEVMAAHEKGLPVYERAELWGAIMRKCENALCVSGTHGKTTTSSMLAEIFMEAGRDPSVMVGGDLPSLENGYRSGAGDTMILESCEYCDSFLYFYPTIAVILNVDNDHLDYFEDIEAIKHSFRAFAQRVPEGGCVIANADDENTMAALEGLDRKLITFGTGAGADCRAVNIRTEGGKSRFEIEFGGEIIADISLAVPGRHNVMNALAAVCAAHSLGVDMRAAETALSVFTGAKRRFEFKGKVNGADIYDDYAHHPGELHALIDAIAALPYKRRIVAFQPHTYSRTEALMDDFVRELSRVDMAVLTEVFAAREQNIHNISAKQISDRIEGAAFAETVSALAELIASEAQPGDLIVTVGAGDIFLAGEAAVNGAK